MLKRALLYIFLFYCKQNVVSSQITSFVRLLELADVLSKVDWIGGISGVQRNAANGDKRGLHGIKMRRFTSC